MHSDSGCAEPLTRESARLCMQTTGAGLDRTRGAHRESSRQESQAPQSGVLGNSLRAAGMSRTRSSSRAVPASMGEDRPVSGARPTSGRSRERRDKDRDRNADRDKDRDRDGRRGERQSTRTISSSRDPARDRASERERASGSDGPKSARYSLKRTQSLTDETGRPQTARERSSADTGRGGGGVGLGRGGGRGGYSYAMDAVEGPRAPAAGAVERGRGNRHVGGSGQPSPEEQLQRASERLVLQVSVA